MQEKLSFLIFSICETSERRAMTTTSSIQYVFQRYHHEILQELHRPFLSQQAALTATVNYDTLLQMYGQMQYHLGWLDQQLCPTDGHPGKLLRPSLLLLSYELAWTLGQSFSTSSVSPAFSLRPALPAAAAIELAHNFTLLHDDIQDGDIERRHRPTVWYVWGVPKAILAGDALFALARLHLWRVLDEGVALATALKLAQLFDMALLVLNEGQFLDMAFEEQQHVSLASYVEMISRKTASLMRSAAEMGALLGSSDQEIIDGLARFGHALGLAFQVRDDMLGIWASEAESGKLAAGDIYRRKKSLPVLHAFQYAQPEDRQAMARIYHQDVPITDAQAQVVLDVFDRTQTRDFCLDFLAQQCGQARQALAQITPTRNMLADRARSDLEALVDFIEGRHSLSHTS
jgi:geranylgeranyl diphosphate synthase type I